jgi:hypothetical protein
MTRLLPGHRLDPNLQDQRFEVANPRYAKEAERRRRLLPAGNKGNAARNLQSVHRVRVGGRPIADLAALRSSSRDARSQRQVAQVSVQSRLPAGDDLTVKSWRVIRYRT